MIFVDDVAGRFPQVAGVNCFQSCTSHGTAYDAGSKTCDFMLGVLFKFLVMFLPTCAIGAGGLWLALKQSGILCAIGWGVAVLFGAAALFEIAALLLGFRRIWTSINTLDALQKRDAELFAQGKSFEEVIAQYKDRPRDSL